MATIIDIKNLQKKLALSPFKLRKIADKILQVKGVRHAQLSLVFVTDRQIKALNTRYLKHRFSTDVISFDFTGRKVKRDLAGRPLKKITELSGEIIVSTDTAVRQSKQFGTTAQGEVVLYMVHGILHLLGYDDHRPRDSERMRLEEQKVLRALKNYGDR